MENKWPYIHELLNFEPTFSEQVQSSGPIFRVGQRKAHYCVSSTSNARKERKEKPTKGVERRTRGRGRRRRHHGGGSCGTGVPHPPRFASGDVDTAVPQRGPNRRLLLLPPVHRLPQVCVSTSARPNLIRSPSHFLFLVMISEWFYACMADLWWICGVFPGLETSQDKSKCQQQFDDYKECKKKEVSFFPLSIPP
jgi:hypothetical protein